jgi:cell wall-associated NlpC family hydrolase
MTTPRPQQIAIRAIICLSVLIMAGCASKAPQPPPTPPPAPEVRPEVSETAYSVQLGAFSVLENAVRLARSLRDTGLEAYYFKHESGLYKVRIGDFATRAEALARAEDLAARDVVEEFWVVGPEDYALARSRIYGSGMLREELVRTAENFIGLPYQWGGSSPDQGFDCSGLTMAVYQLNGLNIPRSSRDQFSRGRPIRRKELHKGDLVFFATKSSGRKVSHVGLYAGDGRFIHAPGTGRTIRTDSLSNPYFSRCYVGARTYL